jgi:hypothetical protein
LYNGLHGHLFHLFYHPGFWFFHDHLFHLGFWFLHT